MNIRYWIEGVLNSYSQVFFSKNKLFAIAIAMVCFMDPFAGLMSLIFVLGVNLLAHLIGFSRESIQDGVYGFNAVLLGTTLSQMYVFNFGFAIVCITAIVLLLLNTSWILVLLGKYQVPMITVPFLLTIWVISLSVRNLNELQPNEQGLFLINQAYLVAGNWSFKLTHCLDFLHLPDAISVYLKTMGGVFYQPTVFAGLLISLALLFSSRIAFVLSLIGFAGAYYFYNALGADVHDLNQNYAGANYIFMAIGLGCFYVIPSKWSFLLVICLLPVLVLLFLFFGKILFVFQLKPYTLAFCACTIITLFLFQHRILHKWIHLVSIQYYSAEKTIYKYVSALNRFKNDHIFKFQLPFWGQWKVSQGYNGTITHLNQFKEALDFVIVNDQNHTYKDPGRSLEDFYCFNKPILAPADGYVYAIENGVDENEIGEVNTEQNWGNTIIMNHLNGLFTQISHIKKDSFKVAVGDFVSKGSQLAVCGSSGRSPEPHIHFQVQLDPKVGSPTYPYPIAYYLEKKDKELKLKYFEVPAENSIIQSIDKATLLAAVFQFSPGKKLKLQTDSGEELLWEVFTDAYNNSYIYCHRSKAVAYFVNDGTLFYFFDFEGNKKSILFHFYLACYRVLLGAYPNVELTDQVPLHYFNRPLIKLAQDFLAPFYLFTEINYRSEFTAIDNPNDPQRITLQSEVSGSIFKKRMKAQTYVLELYDNKIQSFVINTPKLKKTVTCDWL